METEGESPLHAASREGGGGDYQKKNKKGGKSSTQTLQFHELQHYTFVVPT